MVRSFVWALGAAPALLFAQSTPPAAPATGTTSDPPAASTAAPPDPLSQERYLEPPAILRDAVLAPWHTNVSLGGLSPDGTRFVTQEREALAPLERLARPYRTLAGLQIDPRANRRRNFTSRPAGSYRLISLDGKPDVRIEAPRGASLSDAAWSPDGRRVAMFVHEDERTTIWVADAATGKARRLTDRAALPTLANELEWTADGSRLVTILVPSNRPGAPVGGDVPSSPRVRNSDNRPTRIRTFAGLLDMPEDMAAFEFFATGQLAVVDPGNGKVAEVGEPRMFSSVSPSPDGRFFRVTYLERPFSYLFPWSSFPQREVIWDGSGKQLAQISQRGLQTGDAPTAPTPGPGAGPGGRGAAAAEDGGRRALAWRPDGAGLSFLQLEPAPRRDENAPADAPAPRRKDRVMLWKPPFGEKDVEVVYTSDDRITSATYSADAKSIFLGITVQNRARTVLVRPGAAGAPVVLAQARENDDDNPPGSLVTRSVGGVPVARITPDGGSVFFAGTRQFRDPLKEAPRQFVDRVSLADGKRERVWEGRADAWETITLLDDAGTRAAVSRQSPSSPNQVFAVDLGQKTERQVTQNRDFLPAVTQARRETITVTRPDGMRFQVRVTLPRSFTPGSPPPAMFWFYPSEFADQAAYDRSKRSFNKNLFNQPGRTDMELFTLLGYAVVEPDCPLFGPPGTVNNSYVPQLRNNLAATIDALAARGFIDRTRLAIGGHSYGGFSTVNALVHTPFFRAGIAGSGNYNRSLTPFGFQSESRNLWEGREMYLELSPILRLDQITGALFLYHGMDDQNMGTSPINSMRLFDALEALGKPASLAMYPYEDHGQSARQTILDMWARWHIWLERHLRQP